MKILKTSAGPFRERPYFSTDEIELTCSIELNSVGLFPSSPSPIRIERYIEKRFGVTPDYEDLPEGTLGYTEFGAHGVNSITISKKLTEENTKVAERRINSTLAHEVGHGIFHSYLFALSNRREDPALFKHGIDSKKQKILCRDEITTFEQRSERSYDGRWWEYQANSTIGALLLPRELVYQSLKPVMTLRGALGSYLIELNLRERAIEMLVDTFDVNAAVARIRLQELFAVTSNQQLTF